MKSTEKTVPVGDLGRRRWYHSLAAFWAGFFLTNVVPHFVNGASGREFPSPFADPPGVGMSSPTVNVLWGLANLIFGFVLLRGGKVRFADTSTMIWLFLGITTCALALSISFG